MTEMLDRTTRSVHSLDILVGSLWDTTQVNTLTVAVPVFILSVMVYVLGALLFVVPSKRRCSRGNSAKWSLIDFMFRGLAVCVLCGGLWISIFPDAANAICKTSEISSLSSVASPTSIPSYSFLTLSASAESESPSASESLSESELARHTDCSSLISVPTSSLFSTFIFQHLLQLGVYLKITPIQTCSRISLLLSVFTACIWVDAYYVTNVRRRLLRYTRLLLVLFAVTLHTAYFVNVYTGDTNLRLFAFALELREYLDSMIRTWIWSLPFVGYMWWIWQRCSPMLSIISCIIPSQTVYCVHLSALTAMKESAKYYEMSIVGTLLLIVMNYIDFSGMASSLLYHTYYNNFDVYILRFLGGADIDYKDEEGYSLLVRSCANGNSSIARRLIKDGADVTTRNRHGFTALMCCAITGLPQVAASILNTLQGRRVHVPHQQRHYNISHYPFLVPLR
jgi:hypothetical protein